MTRFVGLKAGCLVVALMSISQLCEQEQTLFHYLSFCFNSFSMPLSSLF